MELKVYMVKMVESELLQFNRLLVENAEKTRTEFEQQTRTIEKGIVLSKRIANCASKMGKISLNKPLFQVNQILFARNTHLIIAGFHMIKTGNYTSFMTLLRSIYDNTIRLAYFNTQPAKAGEYIRTGKVTNSEILKVVSGLDEYDKLVNRLHDYVHINMKGNKELIIPTENNQMVLVPIWPVYDRNNAEGCLRALLHFLHFSIGQVVDTFDEQIRTDAGLLQSLSDFKTKAEELLI